MTIKCKIEDVGPRRGGGRRYWCQSHHANATQRGGTPANVCDHPKDSDLREEQFLYLDPQEYRGGIAIWGAVPPVFDTTEQEMDFGIHVHARRESFGPKEFDSTVPGVRLLTQCNLFDSVISISKEAAICYMASKIFNQPIKYLECPNCGSPHLDRDWFAINPHRKHLCHFCGRHFRDDKRAIGNPVDIARRLIEGSSRPEPVTPRKSLKIKQSDFPGGIQIWGSNPAIVWTRRRAEHLGIHLHAYDNSKHRRIDNTYSDLEIDGISISVLDVRMAMALSALPHLSTRIIEIACPKCGAPHKEEPSLAYIPHKTHFCKSCNLHFKAKSRFKKTLANPIWSTISRLSQYAVRTPKEYYIQLDTDTPI